MDYRVYWEIDIQAASPREAAEEAKRIQQDTFSTANVFDVIDEAGEKITVDLEVEEGEACQ